MSEWGEEKDREKGRGGRENENTHSNPWSVFFLLTSNIFPLLVNTYRYHSMECIKLSKIIVTRYGVCIKEWNLLTYDWSITVHTAFYLISKSISGLILQEEWSGLSSVTRFMRKIKCNKLTDANYGRAKSYLRIWAILIFFTALSLFSTFRRCYHHWWPWHNSACQVWREPHSVMQSERRTTPIRHHKGKPYFKTKRRATVGGNAWSLKMI